VHLQVPSPPGPSSSGLLPQQRQQPPPPPTAAASSSPGSGATVEVVGETTVDPAGPAARSLPSPKATRPCGAEISTMRFSSLVTVVFIRFVDFCYTEAMEWIVDSNDSYAVAIQNVSFGDIVTVEEGIYMSCNQVIRASNVTIQALSVKQVFIDCNSSSSHLEILGENVRVQGITFVNGLSDKSGGCISVTGSGVIFQDCRFKRCRSALRGGGIFFSSAAGNATMFNLEVTNCKAGFGGGLFADRFVRLMMRGRIVFQENTASDGGGIFFAASSRIEMVVRSSEIRGNIAQGIGGGFCLAGASISISGDIDFVNNSALSAGALYLWTSLATFEPGSKILFRNNWCGQSGGAMLLVGATVLYSRGSIIFEGNIATSHFHCKCENK
jgi:predicted outer membrane repeat protein